MTRGTRLSCDTAKIGAALVLLAGTILSSACKRGESATGEATFHISKGVTDTEVVLGQPAAFSGPSAGLGVEMWRGATAAFTEANQRGVNGRRIRLVLADDGYEADKAAGAVAELIRGHGVFALFGGVGTPTIVKALPVLLNYFQSDHVFYFSNFTGAQPQRDDPYRAAVFNVRASYRQEAKTLVEAFIAVGRRKIGIFVQNDAYGASGRDAVSRALRDYDLLVVGDTTYPRGQKYQVSTAPQVEALRKAGAEAVIAVGAYQACGAFVRDARNAGWTVPIANVSFVGSDQMLDLLLAEPSTPDLLDNLVNSQVVPSYNDLEVPLVRDYRAAMDRFKPTAPTGIGDGSYRALRAYSFGSLEGYVSARAFLEVLQQTGKDLNRKSFYATAESMGRFDLGLGEPGELSPRRHQIFDKVWLTHATRKGWMPIDPREKVIH
jgi:branched-chain amino acid transport system substrate-binding protein